MRLASFRAGGQDRIGISPDGKTLVEISGPRSLLELVETGQEIRESGETFSLDEVVWHPPVLPPFEDLLSGAEQ